MKQPVPSIGRNGLPGGISLFRLWGLSFTKNYQDLLKDIVLSVRLPELSLGRRYLPRSLGPGTTVPQEVFSRKYGEGESLVGR